MLHNKLTMKRRKQLMMDLMEHRKDDVGEFVEQLSRIVDGFADIAERQDVDEAFAALRESLDDIDCAILDVFLATKLEDAESIVHGFHPEK